MTILDRFHSPARPPSIPRVYPCPSKSEGSFLEEILSPLGFVNTLEVIGEISVTLPLHVLRGVPGAYIVNSSSRSSSSRLTF